LLISAQPFNSMACHVGRSQTLLCDAASARHLGREPQVLVTELHGEIRKLQESHADLAGRLSSKALSLDERVLQLQNLMDSQSQRFEHELIAQRRMLETHSSENKSLVVAERDTTLEALAVESEARKREVEESRCAERANRGNISLLLGAKEAQQVFIDKVDILRGSVSQLQDNQFQLHGDLETTNRKTSEECRRLAREAARSHAEVVALVAAAEKRSQTSLEEGLSQLRTSMSSRDEVSRMGQELHGVVEEQTKAMDEQVKAVLTAIEMRCGSLSERHDALNRASARSEEELQRVVQRIDFVQHAVVTEEDVRRSLKDMMVTVSDTVNKQEARLFRESQANTDAIKRLESALKVSEENWKASFQNVQVDVRKRFAINAIDHESRSTDALELKMSLQVSKRLSELKEWTRVRLEDVNTRFNSDDARFKQHVDGVVAALSDVDVHLKGAVAQAEMNDEAVTGKFQLSMQLLEEKIKRELNLVCDDCSRMYHQADDALVRLGQRIERHVGVTSEQSTQMARALETVSTERAAVASAVTDLEQKLNDGLQYGAAESAKLRQNLQDVANVMDMLRRVAENTSKTPVNHDVKFEADPTRCDAYMAMTYLETDETAESLYKTCQEISSDQVDSPLRCEETADSKTGRISDMLKIGRAECEFSPRAGIRNSKISRRQEL